MNTFYLLILIYLSLPMVVIYDKDKRVRFLICGLLYYLVDTIKVYLDKDYSQWTNDNVKN